MILHKILSNERKNEIRVFTMIISTSTKQKPCSTECLCVLVGTIQMKPTQVSELLAFQSDLMTTYSI